MTTLEKPPAAPEPAKPPAPAGKLTKKDFESDQDVRWCPGCGDYAILSQVQKIMPELGVPRENIVFVSGIGCSSRFPYYMNTFGFHTIHGRAPTIATGLRLARPELTVFVVTGDGDGLSIGGNHLLHVLRRNVDVKILLFNNRIYGLTKGQLSPTSEFGKVTKSSPFGAVDNPVNPISVALGAEATFVARTVDRNLPHMEAVLKRAASHKGAAFIEILQNCPIFNDGAWTFVTDRQQKVETELILQHGKPIVWGPIDKRKGLRLKKGGLTPEVVNVAEVPETDLLLHDEKDVNLAWVIGRLEYPEFPAVPMGVFLDVDRPVFEVGVVEQEQAQISKKGPGEMKELLFGGETWKVS